MSKRPFFPMFVDLSDKTVVVVGGGNVATRRVRTLLAFTRNIRVVSPQITAELTELSKTSQVDIRVGSVRRQDFQDAYMVIAATNDLKLNDDIYRICKAEGIYVNVASDKDKCDFYFPGVVRKGNLVAGVTACGQNHKLAKTARETIEEAFEKLEDE